MDCHRKWGVGLKPKAVLAYCREKGIRTIDLRFTDLTGAWQHLTFPVSAISEVSFEDGFGQEVSFGLEATPPGTAEMAYAVIVPYSEANYLDTSTDPPTLVLLAGVQDILHRQESPWDSRNVANQAVRFLESTSIADELYVRTLLRFDLHQKSDTQSGSGFDKAFQFRCQLMNRAIDAGVNVERHFHYSSAGSFIVLQPTKVLECCDDIAMTRYLMEQIATEEGFSIDLSGHYSATQWKLVKNGEPVFPGNSSRGISDVARYAQGGIIKHAASLAAIFLTPVLENTAMNFPFAANAAVDTPMSLTRSLQDTQSSRSRVIEVRGIPTQGNHYLAAAATLMAMIDGILNKINPAQFDLAPTRIIDPSVSVAERARVLSKAFTSDTDFLLVGDVFSNELLDSIFAYLDYVASTNSF